MRTRWVVSTMFAIGLLAAPAVSQAGVFVSVTLAPPALPVYVQPVCPGDGYIWTPGYWAYGDEGYYWVPGTWVLAPRVGFLWTPGYWGWGGGAYVFHAGYWGPHVGFYGGINYGFGYTGVGFVGGVWNGGVFSYNRAVSNVNVTVVHNVYNQTVVNNTTVNRVSYNGGAGGITARPTPAEAAAEREQHIAATSAQTQHEHAASLNRAQYASVNHGRPTIAASPRPGQFNGAPNAERGNSRPAAVNAAQQRTPPANARQEAPRQEAPKPEAAKSRPAPAPKRTPPAREEERERR